MLMIQKLSLVALAATGTAVLLACGKSTPEEGKSGDGGAAGDPAVAAIDRFIGQQSIDKSKVDWKTALAKPPKVDFAPGKTYFWNLDTSLGPVTIKLNPAVAPMHVSSTIYLTRLGFYDGVVFHRVIPGFMAQGGDPLGRGTGGPGYEYDGEFDATVKHDHPGILSMANRGPGTDGSQFFITFVATPHLNGRHTIFGEVVEGMDTVRAMEKRGSQGGQPSERIEIRTATISVQ